MKDELENKLAEVFPFMRAKEDFREQYKKGMICDLYGAFGCECGDGWYELLYDLCTEITETYKKHDKPVDITVEQIKEKYGELCFYYSFEYSSPDLADVHREVDEIAAKWEKKSAEICEECGKPGALRSELPWIRTLCDDCLSSGQVKKDV